ncbi:MAG: hypothetical protein ALECFALPRED_011120, partial [Alectoria fallacina]
TSDGAPQEANAGKIGQRGGETDARGDGAAWRPGQTAFVNDRHCTENTKALFAA